MAVQQKAETINIPKLGGQNVEAYIIGTSPLIMNRVNEKARRELLYPFGRKRTDADRAGVLKHNPIEEYRASAYVNIGNAHKTRLCFPAPAFKGAMATAALDMPGTKKTEIGRLVWVDGTHVNIYGVPQLYMAIVRNADINHTPDVRTRLIVPRWACRIRINFVFPKLKPEAIANLLNAAGIVAGIGDGRQEKGKLSFGQFVPTDANDPKLLEIIKNGGIKAQDEALEHPTFYDRDTEELFEWFTEEHKERASVRSLVAGNRNGMKAA